MTNEDRRDVVTISFRRGPYIFINKYILVR